MNKMKLSSVSVETMKEVIDGLVNESARDRICDSWKKKENRVAESYGKFIGEFQKLGVEHEEYLLELWKSNFPNKKKKGYPKDKVKTIEYFGSKRRWNKEFTELFKFCKGLGASKIVDCFAGTGVLGLLAAKCEYDMVHLNDLSSLIVNYHRVMGGDDNTLKEFFSCMVGADDYVKSNYKEICKELHRLVDRDVQANEADPVLAAAFYAAKHYGFDGQGGCSKGKDPLEEEMEPLHETCCMYCRVGNISQLSYKELVKQHAFNENSLIMLDPPYMPDTRKQGAYEVEFGKEQHEEMLKILTGTPGISAKVILCGYSHSMYDEYFQKRNLASNPPWHCIKLKRPGKRGANAVAKEHIWVNFEVVDLLKEHSDMFQLIY